MHHKILNFRNIGNIKTGEGIIKPGYFYRGGPLHQLTEETIKTLQKELNIKTVIDFREGQEIKRQSNHKNGFEIVHLTIIGDHNFGNADPVELERIHQEEDPIERMITLYRYIINSKHSQDEYRKFFDVVLASNDPIYFHCSAGKDRTGLAAAFLLKALGASNEDIIDDYLLTNELSRRNIEQMIEQLGNTKPITEHDIQRIHAYSGVHQEYLEAAYDEILKNYDSIEAYLEKALGVDQIKIDKLKEKFIEKDVI